jgi:hypothetical protein
MLRLFARALVIAASSSQSPNTDYRSTCRMTQTPNSVFSLSYRNQETCPEDSMSFDRPKRVPARILSRLGSVRGMYIDWIILSMPLEKHRFLHMPHCAATVTGVNIVLVFAAIVACSRFDRVVVSGSTLRTASISVFPNFRPYDVTEHEKDRKCDDD